MPFTGLDSRASTGASPFATSPSRAFRSAMQQHRDSPLPALLPPALQADERWLWGSWSAALARVGLARLGAVFLWLHRHGHARAQTYAAFFAALANGRLDVDGPLLPCFDEYCAYARRAYAVARLNARNHYLRSNADSDDTYTNSNSNSSSSASASVIPEPGPSQTLAFALNTLSSSDHAALMRLNSLANSTTTHALAHHDNTYSDNRSSSGSSGAVNDGEQPPNDALGAWGYPASAEPAAVVILRARGVFGRANSDLILQQHWALTQPPPALPLFALPNAAAAAEHARYFAALQPQHHQQSQPQSQHSTERLSHVPVYYLLENVAAQSATQCTTQCPAQLQFAPSPAVFAEPVVAAALREIAVAQLPFNTFDDDLYDLSTDANNSNTGHNSVNVGSSHASAVAAMRRCGGGRREAVRVSYGDVPSDDNERRLRDQWALCALLYTAAPPLDALSTPLDIGASVYDNNSSGSASVSGFSQSQLTPCRPRHSIHQSNSAHSDSTTVSVIVTPPIVVLSAAASWHQLPLLVLRVSEVKPHGELDGRVGSAPTFATSASGASAVGGSLSLSAPAAAGVSGGGGAVWCEDPLGSVLVNLEPACPSSLPPSSSLVTGTESLASGTATVGARAVALRPGGAVLLAGAAAIRGDEQLARARGRVASGRDVVLAVNATEATVAA